MKPHKIALLLFPGTNRYIEMYEAVKYVGMSPMLVHWNDNAVQKILSSVGVIIPGGFTYRDRGRAGLVASRNKQIMDAIREKIKHGNPFLGVCNGAQIGLEAKLVTAKNPDKLEMALARNERIKDGKILGTGFYDTWVHVKSVQPLGWHAFNLIMPKGKVLQEIVAHGEGNFQMELDTLGHLVKHNQVAFRYCDKDGNIKPDYPGNPNGSMYNIAAVTNKEGNAMIMMPHPENLDHGKPSDGMLNLIASMKKYIDLGCDLSALRGDLEGLHDQDTVELSNRMQAYKLPEHDYILEFYVTWLTTDNEGFSIGTMLNDLGYPIEDFSRQDYWKIYVKGDQRDAKQLAERIINSSEIIMTTKHDPVVCVPRESYLSWKKTGRGEGYLEEHTPERLPPGYREVQILTMEKQNLVGRSKQFNFSERLGIKEVVGVEFGKLWKPVFKMSFGDALEQVRHIEKHNHLSNPVSMTEERYDAI